MRSKLNLNSDDDDDEDDGHVKLETGVDDGNDGVVTVVGVDEGVEGQIGVAKRADPDHFSYFSSSAFSLSSNVWATGATTDSFSPSEMSSISMLACNGGDFGPEAGAGASCRRPRRGS